MDESRVDIQGRRFEALLERGAFGKAIHTCVLHMYLLRFIGLWGVYGCGESKLLVIKKKRKLERKL